MNSKVKDLIGISGIKIGENEKLKEKVQKSPHYCGRWLVPNHLGLFYRGLGDDYLFTKLAYLYFLIRICVIQHHSISSRLFYNPPRKVVNWLVLLCSIFHYSVVQAIGRHLRTVD